MANPSGDRPEEEPKGPAGSEARDKGGSEVEEAAQELPSFTPQGGLGDNDADAKAGERLPSFTPQGRTDS